MEEITELDMNKYLVLKWEDIHNELSPRQQVILASMIRTCNLKRLEKQGKYNSYLILNLDDEIDKPYLLEQISFQYDKCTHELRRMKVRDIAVTLVNAILKAKEEK